MTTPSTTATTIVPSITRSARYTPFVGGGALVLVVVLFAMPYIAFQDVTSSLTSFLVLLVLATMWNLLAGFGGLVSVGQQAYIGIGAYAVLALTDAGIPVFAAVALAVVIAALISLPTSWLAFRLRGDYFAVGTWVIAEVYRLITVKVPGLGGASGTAFTGLSGMDNAVRGAATYWLALVVAVAALAGCYALLRGRVGLALTAVRDDETAAQAAGVRVTWAKRVMYVVSSAGCAAGGAVLLINALSVQPDAIYSIQWSADMIFIVIIGGIGYLEGPILGTIVFFALQQLLSDYGSWYLVALGLIAVAGAIWLPTGLWGFISDRTGLRLFPVGYHVALPGTTGRRVIR